jgi:hypothetical protein
VDDPGEVALLVLLFVFGFLLFLLAGMTMWWVLWP